MDNIERPSSVPKEGEVEAFDAGWFSHEVGLSREAVELLSHPLARGWALLAWDCRQLMQQERMENG